MRYSVVWYFQRIAQRLGLERERDYLRKVGYGNQDAGGDLTHFWLGDALAISPLEQQRFLLDLYADRLPLSKPALASLALLTFVNTWNDYLGPVIYLRNRDLWTMQIGLQTFISDPQRVQEWSMIMTGSVISVLPIAIIFMLGQRYFVQGIASTGLKG